VGIGVSIFLFAIGAILAFAVDAQTKGIDLNAVGVILMAVGAVGVLLSLIFWSSWGGWARRETIVETEHHRDILEPHHHY
jgi:hypothetical protein